MPTVPSECAASDVVVRIDGSATGLREGVRDLWRYREVLYFLVYRDLKARYHQTVIGSAWVLLQPMLSAAVLTVVLGLLVRVSTGGVPYPVFVYTALIPWALFARGLDAGNSLVINQAMLNKVYFPRAVLPIAAVMTGVVDVIMALPFALLLMAAFGFSPGPTLLAAPVAVLFALAVSLSVSLWLAALTVRFRDFRAATPLLGQLLMFATPIMWPSELVPERWRPLLGVNPMAGVVELFRWTLLGPERAPLSPVLPISLLVTAGVALAGFALFRRVEHTVADVV
ncbi:MAG: ABC transporter permease [Planctomycetes bacterium]|nr:ABC transporter permease [Planctomycetota bacterium]